MPHLSSSLQAIVLAISDAENDGNPCQNKRPSRDSRNPVIQSPVGQHSPFRPAANRLRHRVRVQRVRHQDGPAQQLPDPNIVHVSHDDGLQEDDHSPAASKLRVDKVRGSVDGGHIFASEGFDVVFWFYQDHHYATEREE